MPTYGLYLYSQGGFMTKIKVNVVELECMRCGHEWYPRHKPDEDSMIEVRICPKCKSPYWDKEKK